MTLVLSTHTKCPAPDSVPALGYLRVSKEDQAREEKTSLEDQRTAITALADRLGVTLGDCYTDPGRSGGTAEGRPQFMALVGFCKEHPRPPTQAGYVLVLNDSRWGRFTDPEEAAHWRFMLKKAGWLVRFAEGDSGDSSVRPLERAMHSLQASAYREGVRANAKRGAAGAAAKGFWPNEAPLGYRRVTVGGNRPGTVLAVGQRKTDDEQVKLTPGPLSERQVVSFVFERYKSGEVSLGGLVAELRERWPALRKWSRQTVRAVLRNPAYCGDVVWMRRPHDKAEAAERPVRDKSEWRGKADAHTPIVDRVLFDAVQMRLARNRKETRLTAGGYPLRGLLTCAHCGAPYSGGGGPKGPANDPDRFRFYREKVIGDQTCGHRQGTLQKRVVEPLVVAEVAKVVAHPEVQRLIALELDRVLDAGDDTRTRSALDSERKQLSERRKRLADAVARGVLSDEDVAETRSEITAGVERLTAEAERLRFAGANRRTLAAEKDRLLAMAADFAARASRLSGAALRELLRPWLAEAKVDKERHTISLAIRRIPLVSEGAPGRGSP